MVLWLEKIRIWELWCSLYSPCKVNWEAEKVNVTEKEEWKGYVERSRNERWEETPLNCIWPIKAQLHSCPWILWESLYIYDYLSLLSPHSVTLSWFLLIEIRVFTNRVINLRWEIKKERPSWVHWGGWWHFHVRGCGRRESSEWKTMSYSLRCVQSIQVSTTSHQGFPR